MCLGKSNLRKPESQLAGLCWLPSKVIGPSGYRVHSVFIFTLSKGESDGYTPFTSLNTNEREYNELEWNSRRLKMSKPTIRKKTVGFLFH